MEGCHPVAFVPWEVDLVYLKTTFITIAANMPIPVSTPKFSASAKVEQRLLLVNVSYCKEPGTFRMIVL